MRIMQRIKKLTIHVVGSFDRNKLLKRLRNVDGMLDRDWTHVIYAALVESSWTLCAHEYDSERKCRRSAIESENMFDFPPHQEHNFDANILVYQSPKHGWTTKRPRGL